MRPEDVPAELVEKAARHRFGRHLGHYPEITWESVAESIRAKYLASAADYLAAVLPEIREEAERVLLHEMQNEVKTWHVYESRDTGDVFPSDAVVDLIQDRIDHLREGSSS